MNASKLISAIAVALAAISGGVHAETYDGVMAIVREHCGAYGMGVDYAYTMVHDAPQRTTKLHEALAPVPA